MEQRTKTLIQLCLHYAIANLDDVKDAFASDQDGKLDFFRGNHRRSHRPGVDPSGACNRSDGGNMREIGEIKCQLRSLNGALQSELSSQKLKHEAIVACMTLQWVLGQRDQMPLTFLLYGDRGEDTTKLLKTCKALLEICRVKCSPLDEDGAANHQILVDAVKTIEEVENCT